jgi:opacity protein-like surface antigen
MKKTVVLTVVLIMAMTGFAWAGTDGGYKEIGINGSYSKITNSLDDDETNYSSLGLVFNYFFSAYFSIGGNLRVDNFTVEPDGGDTYSQTSRTINLRADLLAGGPTKTVIPYIGLHGGNYFSESEQGGNKYDSSSFSYGLQGGLKIFPSERVSVNLELDYTTTDPEVDDGQEDYTQDAMSLFVGASFYF